MQGLTPLRAESASSLLFGKNYLGEINNKIICNISFLDKNHLDYQSKKFEVYSQVNINTELWEYRWSKVSSSIWKASLRV